MWDWNEWFRSYYVSPSLQARLRIVREQIRAALNELPSGPIRIISVCAGDGRDLIGAIAGHQRQGDVAAWLLDTHQGSLDRGRTAAQRAGLGRQLSFLAADAGLAGSYAGLAPSDLL